MKRKTRRVFGKVIKAVLLLALVWLLGLGVGILSKKLPAGKSSAIETLPPVQLVHDGTAGAAGSAGYVSRGPERYFQGLLNETELSLYYTIEKGLAEHAEVIEDIKTDDFEALKRVYKYVVYDYPEYFWCSLGAHWSYYEQNGQYTVDLSPTYDIPADRYIACQAEVEAATQGILDTLSGLSEYSKVKGVYEYVITSAVYDDSYTGKTLYELFTDGKAVCEGYARAAQYLLTKLGMEALYVSGYSKYSQADSGGHAWNIVRIGGEYYNMDATWGDLDDDDGTQTVSHAYLCVRDEDISDSHFADKEFYPSCNATTYNYFAQEGKLLTVYDETAIAEWMRQAYLSGVPLEFKAEDRAVFDTVVSQLIDSDGMFDLLHQLPDWAADGYSYNADEEMLIFTVYFSMA